jgi:outer membrane immunogenic protein
MNKFTTAFAAIAVFAPTVGFADGITPDTKDWTGIYVGGQLGGGGVDYSAIGGAVFAEDSFQTYGIHAGYMYDMGTIVVGAELDHDRALLNSSNRNIGITRLKGRIGYDNGRLLPYFTAGVFEIKGDNDDVPQRSDNGTFVGLGAAYLLTDALTLGGEYLTHKIDNFDASGVDFDVETFTLRLSYNF